MTTPHFAAFVNGWLDGTLAAEEHSQMEAELLESAAARDYFWQVASLHGWMRVAAKLERGCSELPTDKGPGSDLASTGDCDTPLTGSGIADLLAEVSGPLIVPPTTAPPPLAAAHPVRVTSSGSPVLGFLGNVLTHATLTRILLVVLAGMACWLLTRLWRPTAGEVAEIVQVASCRWKNAASDSKNLADGRVSPGPGSMLAAGDKLELEAGRAEFRFAGGACVIVKGPAQIQPVSASQMQLNQGMLFAEVPPQAIGFTVETPSARIVDLGTEFTVQVDARQSTEVQVLKGRVESAHRNSDDTFSAPVVLAAGKALRTHRGGVTERIAFAPPKVDSEAQVAKMPVKQKPPEAPTPEKTPPEKKPIGYTVIAHYRLGEDDKPEETGVTRPAVGKLVLRKPKAIEYSADTAEGSRSKQAVSFHGQAGDCLQADGLLPGDLEHWMLEVWVRARKNKNAIILQNGDLEHERFGLQIRDGVWVFVVRDKLAGATSLPCVVGRWTHLTLVRQGDGVAFLVDGTVCGRIPLDPMPLAKKGTFAIGDYPDLSLGVFDGEIDELRFCQLDAPFNRSMLSIGNPDADNANAEK